MRGHHASSSALPQVFGRDIVEAQGLARLEAKLFGRRQPVRIGRYVVGAPIALGGQARVYLGFDPRLRRRVALKLFDLPPAADRLRLRAAVLGEARATARLAHPHVIAVYDVEFTAARDPTAVDCEQLALVMEYIEGEPLSRWLERSPARRSVLDVFIAAGRGLAAIHAAGLIHRDVKPDNMIVGADGRTRVLDLGLARAVAHLSGDGETDVSDAWSGTPHYMAPEQLSGQPLDQRADQFSMCLALHEALGGCYPFVGDDPVSRRRSVIEGHRATRFASGLPRWLRRVLDRGLRTCPAERFECMDALVGALAARGRKRYAQGVGLAVLLTGLGVAAAPSPQGVVCSSDIQPLDGWNEAGRLRVPRTASDDEPFAASRWAFIDGAMRREIAAWQDQREALCSAPAASVPASAWTCLERRQVELSTMIEYLHDEAASLSGVQQAMSELPPMGMCRDAHRAPRLPHLDRSLVQAHTLAQLGAHTRALALAGDVVQQAAAYDLPGTEASALFLQGVLQARSGHHALARTTLLRAIDSATRAGRDDVVAHAAIELIVVSGVDFGSMSEALRWARLAEAMRQRGQTDAETRIAYHHHLANVLAAHQRSDDAQSHYQHALTIARRELSEPRPAMAKLIANLAMIDEDNGETESASRGFGEALALLEERVGTTHPILVPALEGLARTAVVRGQGEAARDALQRALAINESTFGESSLPVAHVLATLGGIHLQEGRPTEARPVLTRALSILQSEPGAETEAASLLTNLGLVHAALNEVEPATARFEAALALFEQIDPQGPRQSYPLLGLARLRLQNGDVEAAASLSQRALELRQEANMPPPLLAEAQLCRAQALAARPPGGPRNEQTCRLARAAQRALADAGIAYVDLLREANDLLAPQTGACPP